MYKVIIYNVLLLTFLFMDLDKNVECYSCAEDIYYYIKLYNYLKIFQNIYCITCPIRECNSFRNILNLTTFKNENS